MHVNPVGGAQSMDQQEGSAAPHVPERPSWDLLNSAELLQDGGFGGNSTGGVPRRDRSDSVASSCSERSASVRGDRRRMPSFSSVQAPHDNLRWVAASRICSAELLL
jgi:hypothetical protein